MSGNTFGKLFTLTSFGESHGSAIGGVVDGCPPGIKLNESDLQVDLDRRKPGTSKFVTQRKESDEVEILSGIFEGKSSLNFPLISKEKYKVESILNKIALPKNISTLIEFLLSNKSSHLTGTNIRVNAGNSFD